ncbi:MAG: hypothetical protein LUG18_05775 [Candidatus Azobacteroides sp.]|nr:hypothetical protein [Candidatus Azobacteroides sp.]
MEYENDWLNPDDSKAISFIRKSLPEALAFRINDLQIEEVIDCVHEFYEEKGMLEEDNPEDSLEIDEEELFSYVYEHVDKELMKDLSAGDIRQIVEKELDYSDKSDGF